MQPNRPTTTAPTDREPSAQALTAIDAEWPVIAAELAVTDAECRLAAHPGDVLAVRSHRRAVRRLLAVMADASTTSTTSTLRPTVRTAPSVVSAVVPVTAA